MQAIVKKDGVCDILCPGKTDDALFDCWTSSKVCGVAICQCSHIILKVNYYHASDLHGSTPVQLSGQVICPKCGESVEISGEV